MLEQFGAEFWMHDGGTVVGAMGFRYPTRMAVMQITNGDLILWSPTALTEQLSQAIDALGPVRFILAPNTLHHSFLAEWKSAYPQAQLLGLAALQAFRSDLSFDGDLSALPEEWREEVDCVVLPATSVMTEAVFFHRASGTVLFTDLLQNLPPRWYSGWRAVIARLDLMVTPEPAVPRKFRLAFGRGKAMRTAIEQILDWPAQRVLMAHGTPVSTDARGFLRRAFAWLL